MLRSDVRRSGVGQALYDIRISDPHHRQQCEAGEQQRRAGLAEICHGLAQMGVGGVEFGFGMAVLPIAEIMVAADDRSPPSAPRHRASGAGHDKQISGVLFGAEGLAQQPRHFIVRPTLDGIAGAFIQSQVMLSLVLRRPCQVDPRGGMNAIQATDKAMQTPAAK